MTLLYKYCLRYVCLVAGKPHCISILAFRSRNNVEQTLVCDTPFSVKIKMYENLLALCSADRSSMYDRISQSAAPSIVLNMFNAQEQT